MKKCVSVILVIIMLLSCSAVAFADSSDANSTAQLYVGSKPDSEFRDYLCIDPDSVYGGAMFSTSKSPNDALEDNFDSITFPSFITPTLKKGGQFELTVSNAKAGDEGYITYLEKGVLYKLKVNILYGPGSPYVHLNPDVKNSDENQTIRFTQYCVPTKSEIKKEAALYMKTGGNYMYSDYNVHFEKKDQIIFCKFFTSKSQDAEVSSNIDKIAFPYFLDAYIDTGGQLSFRVNDNAHYGNYGYITYFDNGTLYKLKINVFADQGALPENQKSTLAAKGRAESAAIIAAGKQYEISGQTAAETKPAESVTDFLDIFKSDYYYDSVDWAVKNEITAGTSNITFSPKTTCTRGQVVTFLWRMHGKPVVNGINKFSDVKDSDFYAQAVTWAVNCGITVGTSETTFSPNTPCTNAQIICFIQRATGAESKETGSTWYDGAIAWANENKMLDGTYSGAFNPSGACPRCNVVEYLYRLSNIK